MESRGDGRNEGFVFCRVCRRETVHRPSLSHTEPCSTLLLFITRPGCSNQTAEAENRLISPPLHTLLLNFHLVFPFLYFGPNPSPLLLNSSLPHWHFHLPRASSSGPLKAPLPPPVVPPHLPSPSSCYSPPLLNLSFPSFPSLVLLPPVSPQHYSTY